MDSFDIMNAINAMNTIGTFDIMYTINALQLFILK